ncbi:MAG: type I restriction endonuclease [Spirulina sp.]
MTSLAAQKCRSEIFGDTIEQILFLFESLKYTTLLQSDIVSGRHQPILQSHYNYILGDRFCQAMQRINPNISLEQVETILHQLRWPQTMPGLKRNYQWHRQLLHGIAVKPSLKNPEKQTILHLLDFSDVAKNDWLVIYSFPVIEADYQHCLDLVVFINGLPLVVFHGLHGQGESWSLRAAYLQLREYQAHLPKFFSFNEFLVFSTGEDYQIGTLTSSWKQLVALKSSHKKRTALSEETPTELFIKNVFSQQNLLEILRRSITFTVRRTLLNKKITDYSFGQFYF